MPRNYLQAGRTLKLLIDILNYEIDLQIKTVGYFYQIVACIFNYLFIYYTITQLIIVIVSSQISRQFECH